MPAVSFIFTIDFVAEQLGYDKDQLFDVACDQMEPEDGLIWIYGTNEKQEVALTPQGIEFLDELIKDQYRHMVRRS